MNANKNSNHSENELISKKRKSETVLLVKEFNTLAIGNSVIQKCRPFKFNDLHILPKIWKVSQQSPKNIAFSVFSILCNVYYWRLLKLVLSKAVTARKLHKIAIYWYSFSNFTTIFNITLLELSMHFFCFLMGSVFWNDLLILIFHFYDDAQQNMF